MEAPGQARSTRTSALALLPLVGLAQGALAAAVAMPLDTHPVVAAAAGLAVLDGAARLRPARGILLALAPRRALGWALACGMLGVRMMALASLEQRARLWALVLAPLLGRWAMVVQCYGATAVRGADGLGQVEPIAFGAFAWTSVLALGVTQAVGGGVGVLLVFAICVLIVIVRVLVHRRLGGFTGALLWATDALVETTVAGTVAWLAQLKT